jgi:hypothetical protein
MRAMEEGRIVRFEELTRMGSDVQDTFITVLSEKTLPSTAEAIAVTIGAWAEAGHFGTGIGRLCAPRLSRSSLTAMTARQRRAPVAAPGTSASRHVPG